MMPSVSRLPLPPVRLAVLVLAVLGALLLVVAEFSPLLEVQTLQVVVKTVDTGSHHAYAQVLIAVVAVVFAWGAAKGGSRPALLGLAGLAAVSLAISLIHDLPDTSKTGNLADRFESAKATPKSGMYLESLGGVFLLLSATTGLFLGEAPEPRRRARPGPDEAGPSPAA
jgi:hypothetical protein